MRQLEVKETMEKNELLMTYGTDYKEMTKRLLEEADLIGHDPHRSGGRNSGIFTGKRLQKAGDSGGLLGRRQDRRSDADLRLRQAV